MIFKSFTKKVLQTWFNFSFNETNHIVSPADVVDGVNNNSSYPARIVMEISAHCSLPSTTEDFINYKPKRVLYHSSSNTNT